MWNRTGRFFFAGLRLREMFPEPLHVRPCDDEPHRKDNDNLQAIPTAHGVYCQPEPQSW
jgi:hypothetical protein